MNMGRLWTLLLVPATMVCFVTTCQRREAPTESSADAGSAAGTQQLSVTTGTVDRNYWTYMPFAADGKAYRLNSPISGYHHQDDHGFFEVDLNGSGWNENGKAVLAPVAGQLTGGFNSCFGNYGYLDDGCGNRHKFYHMQARPSSGYVAMGTRIGVVGNTGTCSDGAHLHHEVVDASGNAMHLVYFEVGRPSHSGDVATPQMPISQSGWTPVGRNTLSAWGASLFSGRIYGVHRGGWNKRMYVASTTSPSSWGSWTELPGETDNTVAVAGWNATSRVAFAHLGLDGTIYFGTRRSSVFEGWQSTSRSSTAPPDICTLSDRLTVIHKGRANAKMYYGVYNWTTKTWSSWTELPGETDDRPGVAVYRGVVWAVHKGQDRRIYIKPIGDTSGWTFVGRTTDSAPSMLEFNNRLYLIHRGESNDKMYYSSMGNVGEWRSWTELPGRTTRQPGLVILNGALYAICVAPNNDMYILRIA